MGLEAIQVKKLKVADARGELGLRQEDLANLAGVSRQVVYHAEHEITISRLRAHKILQALNKERVKQGLPKLDIDSLDWSVKGDGV